jgi:hypothetical protein
VADHHNLGGENKKKFIFRNERLYTTSKSNDAQKARLFGQGLKEMTLTAYRVWFGMQIFSGKWNKIDARLQQIADFCSVSFSSAQRAMAYFEKNNLIVREKKVGNSMGWMINPSLQWNFGAEDHQKAIHYYHRLCELARAGRKKEVDLTGDGTELNEEVSLIEYDTICDEPTEEPGDAPCASKLKAA